MKKIILATVIVLFALIGGYLVVNSQQSTSPILGNTPSVTSSEQISITPSQSDTPLPRGWTYKESSACNISLPFPPETAPYAVPTNSTDPEVSELDKGGKWRLQENNRGERMFPNLASVFYFKPDLPAGDYVAGTVQVTCAPNTQNYTTESLLEKFKGDFDVTYPGMTFKDKGEKRMWEHTVHAFSVEGGIFAEGFEEYLLATPTHIYRINTYAASSTPIVKETANTIFQNLRISH